MIFVIIAVDIVTAMLSIDDIATVKMRKTFAHASTMISATVDERALFFLYSSTSLRFLSEILNLLLRQTFF